MPNVSRGKLRSTRDDDPSYLRIAHINRLTFPSPPGGQLCSRLGGGPIKVKYTSLQVFNQYFVESGFKGLSALTLR